MGKPTGFMDYKRAELALRAPEERIKDWQEIKTSSLPHKEALRCQAARCMDCGVPFCHSGVVINRMVSGCPLHNLMRNLMILFTMGWMIMPMPVLIKPTIFRNLHLTSVLLPVRVPATQD